MKRKKNRLIQILVALFLSSLSLSAQTIFDQLAGKVDMVVDINGSGDFTTVQEAINAVPDNNDTWKVIFVKKGVYYEKVILGYKKTKVILVGEDVDSTIISNDNYGDEMLIGGDPNNGGHTFSTYTFRADAHDFQAYNISFENPTTKGQGVAYHSNGDRQILYHCRLLGNQDTYFDNFRTRKYFKDCFIEGTTDYIFGFGVTLFDSCQIHSKSGSYITAASTPEYYEFGQVFKDCRLTANPGVSGIFLGRPWYDWGNTTFYECWEPASINSAGWSGWGGREATCSYKEYNCFGPGSDTLNRVEFGKQLDPSKASRYNIDTIFAASNFPSDMGYDVDTNEFMHMRRRQEASGYPARADTIIFAGREELYASGDSFPPYPKENWSPVFYNDVYEVIKNNTYRMMDSINGIINIENMLLDGNALDGFDPEITGYGIELDENDTTGPVITMVAENAIVSINYPATLPGFSTVTALSKDKTNGTTYSLYYSKDSSYWDTELKQIVVNFKDTLLIEPGILEYNIRLQPGDTKVRAVYVYVKVSGQTYTKTLPATLPGVIEVEVTAIDKVTRSKYVIYVDLPSGTEDLLLQNTGMISLLNPVRDKLLVFYPYEQPASLDIDIYDLNGKLIRTASLMNLSTGISESNVDVSSFNTGIYIYRIKLEEDNIFGKMMKLEN